MSLSTAQLSTLKTNITANTAVFPSGPLSGTQVKDAPNTADGNLEVAKWYSLAASPAFTVWRKSVGLVEVGDKLNGTELAGLSSLNNTRLQTVVLLSQDGVNPSMADRRQFFDDIFSGAGGTTTRANLLALWKQPATNAKKLFSTGTGSDAVPATTASNIIETFELTADEVQLARNLP